MLQKYHIKKSHILHIYFNLCHLVLLTIYKLLSVFFVIISLKTKLISSQKSNINIRFFVIPILISACKNPFRYTDARKFLMMPKKELKKY